MCVTPARGITRVRLLQQQLQRRSHPGRAVLCCCCYTVQFHSPPTSPSVFGDRLFSSQSTGAAVRPLMFNSDTLLSFLIQNNVMTRNRLEKMNYFSSGDSPFQVDKAIIMPVRFILRITVKGPECENIIFITVFSLQSPEIKIFVLFL